MTRSMPPSTYDEVDATKTMIDRTEQCFDSIQSQVLPESLRAKDPT
jgi:hypothetical protein